MKKTIGLMLLITLSFGVVAGQSSPLGKLAIYVLAEQAKFIGDYTGGALVSVYHRDSGELLSQGLTQGGTGQTKHIMETQELSAKITKDAAFYLASFNVAEATPVTIEVKGPMGYPQATKVLRLTSWVYPDRPVQPIVLTLPGYIVEGQFKLIENNALVTQAKVRMLCGCALSTDGYWLSSEVYVWAEVYSDNRKLASAELNFIGDSSYSTVIDAAQWSEQPTRLVIHARGKDGLQTGSWQQQF